MISFGRKKTVEESITDLTARINEQKTLINESNTDIVNSITVLRAYLETSESRIKHEITQELEQNLKSYFDEVSEKISKIKPGTSAPEMIKQINKNSKEETLKKKIRSIKILLNQVLAENLIDGMPLFTTNSTSKYPTLTRQGKAIYNSWGNATVNLAKILGCKKEKFTNAFKFNEFFKNIHVKKYGKMSVNYSADKTIKTVSAAIILNGYAKEYTQFLLDIVQQKYHEVGNYKDEKVS